MGQVNTLIHCKHCHEPVKAPFYDNSKNVFCCQGCLSVYSILEQGNLQQFYKIQDQTGDYTKPVSVEDTHFDYLNHTQFLNDYGSFQEGLWSMSFYLKGVHCLACLWLIERLPELVEEVKEARLNIGKSLVTITLHKDHDKFKKAAETLNKLGYPPFPISNQDELEKLKLKEERSLLLKIGIAGFSMMNIMLYAGSVYAGANGGYSLSFGLLSFILVLPVVTYCASPFYKSAWSSLKNKRVNIDIPLSLAIILGFLISSYFLLMGKELIYFDSITTLTFLILLSRFVLRKVQQTSLNKNDLSGIFQRGSIQRKMANGDFEHIHPDQLNTGDSIAILPNQVFPCDGVITKGATKINLSTLTGESQNILHEKGSKVFMGTLNIGSRVEVKAEKVGRETRLGKLLTDLEHQSLKESHYSYLTDTVSKYFVNIIILVAIVSFFANYSFLGFEKALENTLALIIVTCPCAFGLATPLTFSRIMSLGQSHGIIIKTEDALEKLTKVKNIIFDKTGTLTKGDYSVTKVEVLNEEHFSQFSPQEIAFSLECKSSHPVAKAITQWANTQDQWLNTLEFDSYEEILGFGIRAKINQDSYEAFSSEGTNKDTIVNITKNGEAILKLTLNDSLREEAPATLKTLRANGYQTYLFSGDKEAIVNETAALLEFKERTFLAQMSPEDKAQKVRHLPHSLFVGDGANDSLAFNEAMTSIATHGSVEVSLRVADIFLTQPNLEHINKALFLAQKAINTVKINLSFSLMYNISGAVLAIFGFIGPLEAAVLMPLSSLTVLGITLFQTRDNILEISHGNS